MCEIMDCARNARTWEEIEDDSCFDPVPQEAHPPYIYIMQTIYST